MRVSPLVDENELLHKIAAGDQRAFKFVFEYYYNHVYVYALHLTKSEPVAEEIVQETFLKLWRQEVELKKIKKLEGYLITLARNRAIDYLRRVKLQIKIRNENDLTWLETHNETEERIILNDTRRIVQDAINQLPPQQKKVFQLCWQEGLKHEEVAEKMNLSVLTVQSYMKLALNAVRKYVVKNTDIAIVLILFKII